MLLLLLANVVEVSLPADYYLPDLLAHIARETHLIPMYDEGTGFIDRQYYGPELRHRVARERVADTYCALLAFFEIDTQRIPKTPLAVVGGWSGRGFVLRRPRIRRGRFRVVFAGIGVLELGFSSIGYVRRPELMQIALLPDARRRLMHTLLGMSPKNRATAARLLRWLGPLDDSLLAALRKATQDRNATVREEAHAALREHAQRVEVAKEMQRRERKRHDPMDPIEAK